MLENLYAIYEQDLCMGDQLGTSEDDAIARFRKLRGYTGEAPLFAQLLKSYGQRVADWVNI